MTRPYLQSHYYIDIVVLVVGAGPPLNSIRRNDQTTLTQWQLQIIDSEYVCHIYSKIIKYVDFFSYCRCTTPMQLTLWERLANEEGEIIAAKVGENPVIVLTCIKVQDFQGMSFCTTGNTMIKINPDIEEAQVLREWANTNQMIVEEHKKNQQSSIPSIISSTETTNISAIINDKQLPHRQVQLCKVQAWIVEINNQQDPWYPSCTLCKKKVEKSINAKKCERCHSNKFEVVDRYLFKIKVGDKTGSFWITLFDKEVEKLFACEASEMKKLK
ncbi:replication protein A 70 kDa DNA-binding subunit B-like isoform X2 [Tasmannia lanceolata]